MDSRNHTYLRYGYLPDSQVPSWIDDCLTPDAKGRFYTPEEVGERLDTLFDSLLEDCRESLHIVPLSGGWDSRLILGELLARVSRDRIETVTFGVPGQFDHDLARTVADWAGVRHHAIDLRQVSFEWESLLESTRHAPWTYIPDGYINQLARERINNDDAVLWSGFMGDPLAGSHLYEQKPADLSLQAYLQSQIRSKDLSRLLPRDEPAWSLSRTSRLSVEDLLDIIIRQRNCIYPIIVPGCRWEGWDARIGSDAGGRRVVAPFIDRQWAGYWLTAPRSQRLHCSLFLETFAWKFPELFALPAKSRLGLPAGRGSAFRLRRFQYRLRKRLQRRIPRLDLAPRTLHNYLDENWAYRERGDFQELLTRAERVLADRNAVPWLDIGALRKAHLARRMNLGRALDLLVGLALNLEREG